MSWAEVKYALNSSLGTDSFTSLDKMIIINSLLSNNDTQIDWAFRQNGIGSALDMACNVNSAALAACDTVNEIAASTAALDAIKANKLAFEICCKNETIVQKFSDEDIIAAGIGSTVFEVADLVTLNYNGNATKFRVVHRDYLTKGKIVLLSEDCVSQEKWNANDTNNYSPSTIRTYLNSTVLKGFSQKIQNAITMPDLPCHDNTTAKILNDKIWLPSYTEVGYNGSQYAPVEGSVFDYYNGAFDSKRIKKFNNNAVYWWLRTPYINAASAWGVRSNGSAGNGGVTSSNGVAFALEI
jgi:hypothetical protein